MEPELDIKQLRQDSKVFDNAYVKAFSMDTDQLAEEFNPLDYHSFGFGALMIHKLNDSNIYEVNLRNNVDWQEQKVRCSGKLKEALAKMYAWCVLKGYLHPEWMKCPMCRKNEQTESLHPCPIPDHSLKCNCCQECELKCKNHYEQRN